MKSYDEALQKLHYPRIKDSKKLENNTYLIKKDDKIAVRLHKTDVVVYSKNYCQLFTGGWFTATTKDRINKYAPVYITQKDHLWFMSDGSRFFDGIRVDYTGKILNPKQDSNKILAKNKKIKARIKKYAKLAVKKLERGLPLPSGGDCWFCCMKDVGNMTLGDISKNPDHLISHMQENYIVPSLIFNAVKEAGYKDPGFIIGYIEEDNKMGGKYCMKESVYRAIYKYLVKRLIER